jgi:hypothetical protein
VKFKVDTINKVVFIRFSKDLDVDLLFISAVHKRELIQVLEMVWKSKIVFESCWVCAIRICSMTYPIPN